jgi:RNA polymerase primary sigma factor/RNA polymerase sigma factor
MIKEGQEVSYQRWAEEAGVDEAELKRRLQAGYCCRERLIVTTEWLVRYIARTYTGMGTAFDDLLQVANIASSVTLFIVSHISLDKTIFTD